MVSDFDFEAFDEGTWYNWQQRAYPLFLDPCFDACAGSFREYFGIPFFTSVLYYRPAQDRSQTYLASWLLRTAEGVATGRSLVDMLLVPSFAVATEAAFTTRFRTALHLGESLLREERSSDPAAAARTVSALGTAYQEAYTIGAITEPVAWYCEDRIRAEGIKNPSLDNEAIASLLAPTFPPYVVEYERSLLALAERAHATLELTSVSDRAIDDHMMRFGWVNNSYSGSKRLTPEEVLKEAAAHLDTLRDNLARTAATSEQRLWERQKNYDSLPIFLRRLVDVNDRFGSGLQDIRKVELNRLIGLLDDVARRASVVLEIGFEEARFLSPHEWPLLVADRSSAEDLIDGRRRGYVLTLSAAPLDDEEMRAELSQTSARWVEIGGAAPRSGEASRYIDDAARTHLMAIDDALALFRDHPQETLRGTVASRGNPPRESISARAQVVLDPHGGTFEAGSILVASSTTPDFVGLMRRSVAIVTQQGSLASHAAITARELGLPCVVGVPQLLRRVSDGSALLIDLVSGTISLDDGTNNGRR